MPPAVGRLERSFGPCVGFMLSRHYPGKCLMPIICQIEKQPC